MASETTKDTSAAPLSRWSDEEKIALLLSVIKSLSPGKIIWANVDVPAGRTTGSSQKQYEGLLKAASSVPMTSGEAITPAKKRAASGTKKTTGLKEGDGTPATPKKRGRKPKKVEASEATVPAEEDDEEEEPDTPVAKKVKVEKEEDLIGDEVAAEAEAGFADD
ncbi:hypothetical protein P7C71_g4410, partial [Lecanoromycetidae sp. Uapishka_2]